MLTCADPSFASNGYEAEVRNLAEETFTGHHDFHHGAHRQQTASETKHVSVPNRCPSKLPENSCVVNPKKKPPRKRFCRNQAWKQRETTPTTTIMRVDAEPDGIAP